MLAALSGAASAQTSNSAATAHAVSSPVTARPDSAEVPGGRYGLVLKQIEDPSTGDVWLLELDPSRPAGPAHLVLAGRRKNATPAFAPQRAPLAAPPMIHAGDAVIVEEHTALADVRLEAVALERAAQGELFKARLKIGGRVVSAVATEAGRASFAPESEAAR